MELPSVSEGRKHSVEDELEQALVALEDSQRETAALLADNASLRAELADARAAQGRAEARVRELEARLQERGDQPRGPSSLLLQEELRTAMEELQVMVEELEFANEKLRSKAV